MAKEIDIFEARDLLKKYLPYENAWFGISVMDNNLEKGFALFRRKANMNATSALGGVAGYKILPCTLLMRWGRDVYAAEKKKEEIFDAVLECGKKVDISDGVKEIIPIMKLIPKCLGTDKKGVFEYSFDIDFIIEA